jgi:hypothetical protein
MQVFDFSNQHSAACGFSDAPIFAGPEVNFDWAVGDDAVFTLRHVNLRETQLGDKELSTSLDIK